MASAILETQSAVVDQPEINSYAPPAAPAPVPTAAATEPPADAEEEEEELEDVPKAEKEADPLLGVRIRRNCDGQEYEGVVEDIEMGKRSRERLYQIKYTDGDLEHLTKEDVERCRVPLDAASKVVQPLTDHLDQSKQNQMAIAAGQNPRERRVSSPAKKPAVGGGARAAPKVAGGGARTASKSPGGAARAAPKTVARSASKGPAPMKAVVKIAKIAGGSKASMKSASVSLAKVAKRPASAGRVSSPAAKRPAGRR